MEIRPVFSALMRNKTGAALIALQVAITLAVLVNAGSIVWQRVSDMARPSGIDSANIVTVHSNAVGESYDWRGGRLADIEALRALPGVRAVTSINSLPLSDGGWSLDWILDPERPELTFLTAAYGIDQHGLDALGLSLVEGRWFVEADVVEVDFRSGQNFPTVVVMSQKAAELAFPGESALGRRLYLGEEQPATVVGIVENVAVPWPDLHGEGLESLYQSVFLPAVIGPRIRYAIRTEPGEAGRLLPRVEEALLQESRERVVGGLQLHADIVSETYGRDIAMIRILAIVMVLLVTITALGIVGLASFNVRQRTKQIGTRRALGATRLDILRLFMLETGLVVGTGVVLGTLLTLGLNAWLVQSYSVPRLEPAWLPAGMLALLVLGQIAALAPAQRATRVSPAVATRTV